MSVSRTTRRSLLPSDHVYIQWAWQSRSFIRQISASSVYCKSVLYCYIIICGVMNDSTVIKIWCVVTDDCNFLSVPYRFLLVFLINCSIILLFPPLINIPLIRLLNYDCMSGSCV